MKHFHKNLLKILLLLLLVLLASVLISQTFFEAGNTLYRNQRWTVTKTTLNKAVLGSFGFLSCRNSLSGSRLDLSKWHGFQEILYKDALRIKEVSFDLFCGKNSYLSFIFNKDDNGFSGIRISANPLFKSGYFTSKNSGEFLTFEELPVLNLKKERWNECRIAIKDAFCTLSINKKVVGRYRIKPLERQRIGFRGGKDPAYVDNVVIHPQTPGRALREDFGHPSGGMILISVLALLSINGMIAGIFFVIRKGPFFTALPKLIGVNVFVVILCSIVLFCYSLSGYPGSDHFMDDTLRAKEDLYWKNAAARSIRSELSEKYQHPTPENSVRIMFIGSSQTWGAGASAESKTFVNLIQEKLNRSTTGETRYECINAGISGANSSGLLELYTKEWLRFQPKIVIIILSTNDGADENAFARNLKSFIEINKAKGIRTVFVLEANEIEFHSSPLKGHKVMREVGNANNILTLDLHGHLLKNYDKGFLWWDFVHLTDFGQEIAAEYLFKMLTAEGLPGDKKPTP